MIHGSHVTVIRGSREPMFQEQPWPRSGAAHHTRGCPLSYAPWSGFAQTIRSQTGSIRLRFT